MSLARQGYAGSTVEVQCERCAPLAKEIAIPSVTMHSGRVHSAAGILVTPTGVVMEFAAEAGRCMKSRTLTRVSCQLGRSTSALLRLQWPTIWAFNCASSQERSKSISNSAWERNGDK